MAQTLGVRPGRTPFAEVRFHCRFGLCCAIAGLSPERAAIRARRSPASLRGATARECAGSHRAALPSWSAVSPRTEGQPVSCVSRCPNGRWRSASMPWDIGPRPLFLANLSCAAHAQTLSGRHARPPASPRSRRRRRTKPGSSTPAGWKLSGPLCGEPSACVGSPSA
jgi:hypothetical protein